MCAGTKRGNSGIISKLASQLDPWALPTVLRIPGITDKNTHPGGRNFCHTRLCQKVSYTRKPGSLCTGVDEVKERSQGMSLTAAELGEKSHNRRCVLCSSGETP